MPNKKNKRILTRLKLRPCRTPFSATFNTICSTIFTEPEENKNYCFSIITQVITRPTAFSLFLLRKTSTNCAVAILKISASPNQYCNHLAWGDYSKM